jgi:hypothetical protein
MSHTNRVTAYVALSVSLVVAGLGTAWFLAHRHGNLTVSYSTHGLTLRPPSDWQEQSESIQYQAGSSEPGLTATSPDRDIVLAYWRAISESSSAGIVTAETAGSATEPVSEEQQVVSVQDAKYLPGILDVQVISHTAVSSDGGASIYDAIEMLMTETAYDASGLNVHGMVGTASDRLPGFRPSSTGPRLRITNEISRHVCPAEGRSMVTSSLALVLGGVAGANRRGAAWRGSRWHPNAVRCAPAT